MNNKQAKQKELPSAGYPVGTLVKSRLSSDSTFYVITKPIDHQLFGDPTVFNWAWQPAYSFAYERYTMVNIKCCMPIEKKTT